MKNISKALAKGAIATVAAGAMAVTSATPAFARDHRDNDGIGAGEIIAGALIIGGIAAIASAASNDRDRYDDRYDDRYGDRYGDRYNNRNGYGRQNSRHAVEQCVQAAERTASRYSYGGNANVTDIRRINRTRDGYTVKGRIAVNQMNRNWRSGDRNYGRGWDNDHRGWNNRYRGYDAGNFTCKVRYGRIADLDFSGIRGL
jgi:hypothetical protein